MGTVTNAFGSMTESIIGFVLKLVLLLAAIAFGMALVVILAVNWPFTLSFIVCICLSEVFYKKVEETTNILLPEYFSINIEDFLATFSQGDEEIDQLRNDLEEKREAAEKQVAMMREAYKSAENQLEQIKSKKKVKSLFSRQPAEVSERAARALEMELGKPKWTQYIDKASQEANGEWERLLA